MSRVMQMSIRSASKVETRVVSPHEHATNAQCMSKHRLLITASSLGNNRGALPVIFGETERNISVDPAATPDQRLSDTDSSC